MTRSAEQAASDPGLEIVVRDLGRMSYGEAFTVQKSLQQRVIEARARRPVTGHLLLVEHEPPVITVSRRRTAREHLLATPEQLAEGGVEVCETDRGGDITYHGPGQLVVYPILDLNVLGLRLHGYMRLLEQAVIDVLRRYGLQGLRDPSATGVWLADDGDAAGPGSPKICAMGVRVSRWVTMHGLALNVSPDLDHFGLIVPCGLAGRAVTSLEVELGPDRPSMEDVKHATADVFREATGRLRRLERAGTRSDRPPGGSVHA